MPVSPHRPRELQWQIFRGSHAVGRRLVSAKELRGKAWVRVRQDVYADARLERDHELYCRAAGLRLPASVVIAGPSAAYLDGVRHAAGPDDDVHVVAPPGVVNCPRRGLRIHHTDLSPDEYSVRSGLRRTTPARTAWDLALWLDLVRAVSVIDGMLALGLLLPTELVEMVDRRRSWRGSQSAARAFDLADSRAQSAPESQLRVRLILAGLPRPVAQHPVRCSSGVLLHPDLAWPQFKVAVEYDGQWHGDPDQLHHDRRRINKLVSAGWIVLHVTSRRLANDFPGVVYEVRAALTSRGWRP
jgi:very-short-patch-repair endonuclease